MIKKVKQIAIAFAALALATFGLTGVNSGIAATEVGGVDEVPATTTAGADTLEACSWYVTGLAADIALANGDDMEYVGNDYTLTATDEDIQIFFSASDTPSQRCSFYDDERGVQVQVAWAGEDFTTGTLDTSLDFSVGDDLEAGGSVTVDITYDGECSEDWTAGATKSIGVDVTPLVPASIANDAVSAYTPTLKAGATFASCTLDATYTTKLPGNKTPANPGTSYDFNGPTLTTTVTMND